MFDIDGNVVQVGDLVRVLAIDHEFLDHCLTDEERVHHSAMLGNEYRVDAILEGGTKASVSIAWRCEEGIATGGLHMLPAEFRLVRRSRRVRLFAYQLDVASLTAQGEAARQLLVGGEVDALAQRYGYALAGGREPADAIRADTLEALVSVGATGFSPDPALTRVSYVHQAASGLFALIEVQIPVDSGKTILLELVVSGDMPLHVTLEQISGDFPADAD